MNPLTLMKLKKHPHPCLYEVATPVKHGTDLSFEAGMMFKVMYGGRGIGLAGNQVGLMQRIIVMDVNGFKKTIINPEIIKSYGGYVTQKEGCLSFPGQRKPLSRARQIIVTGFDLNWKPIKHKLKGLTARCVQHEVDHLNGINLLDER